MPRRDNRTQRRGFRTRDRQRILVVCGGERTEPAYLIGLRDALADLAVDVRVLTKPRAPIQIVEFARSQKSADFDEVWCLFDVDEFDIPPAVIAARKAGVRLAISNPCFELWLLLHHEACHGHLPKCQTAIARLKKHLPSYDKTALDFADFAEGLTKAIVRGKALESSGEEHTVNPSTNVWRLVEKIMGEQ